MPQPLEQLPVRVEAGQRTGFQVITLSYSSLYTETQRRAQETASFNNEGRKRVPGSISPNLVKLSETFFNDALINKETTSIWALEGEASPLFSIRSAINLSETRMNQDDRGYFSERTIQAIVDSLREKGLRVEIRSHFKVKTIYVNHNGFWVEVDFGFPSQEVERESYTDLIGRVRGETVAEIDECSIAGNKCIYLQLVTEGRALRGELITANSGLPELSNEGLFREAVDSYAQVYQDFIEAFYLSQELEAPNQTVIFDISTPG